MKMMEYSSFLMMTILDIIGLQQFANCMMDFTIRVLKSIAIRMKLVKIRNHIS